MTERPKGIWRLIPKKMLPLLAATYLWDMIAFYLPKLLMLGKPHYDLAVPADRLIPFVPATVIVYLAAMPSWVAGYFYCIAQEKERAYRFFCADVMAKLICFVCFLLLPTAIVRPEVTGNSLCEYIVRFVFWFDSPTNLFPSIHCLLNWLIYRFVHDMPNVSRGVKAGVLLFAFAVFASTLTMKQHYLVDVFAGVAVAELCYRLAGRQSVLRVFTGWADRLAELPDRFRRRYAEK